MEKKEILEGLKNEGMSFIYNNWHLLTDSQKKEILISSLYILSNNGLLHNEKIEKNTLIDELDNFIF